MPSTKLKHFLDENRVKYVFIHHSPAYTAQEIAASAHIPGRELAKSVLVTVDNDYALVVLPASENLDASTISKAAGGGVVMIASEDDLRRQFPDCQVGAMPPFGNLYNLKVYASSTLEKDKEIAFNAGSHTELIRMAFTNFKRLVNPTMVDFP